MPVLFETERLIVRHFTQQDSDAFFAINGDEEVVRYIRAPKSREECNTFLTQTIEGYAAKPLEGRWAAVSKANNIVVGSFAFIPIENSDKMQVGYALLKDSWGRGYATELTLGGLHYVFSKSLLAEVYGITEVANTPSQKVLLKAGFVFDCAYTVHDKEIYRYKFQKSRFLYRMA
jgi:ribosomal-protein-alanine N-acetyltransferase